MTKAQIKNTFTFFGFLLALLVISNAVLLYINFRGGSLEGRTPSMKMIDERIAEFSKSEEFNTAVAGGIEAYIKANDPNTKKDELAKGVKPLQENDHIIGNPDAEILLIEYSDLECPFCTKFHATAQEVVDNSAGKVAWIYRHFPLNIHPGAQKKGEAAECAAKLGGNDAFWEFTDLLFEKGTRYPVADLATAAEEMGLDKVAFQDCLDSGEMADRVKTDLEEGAAAGITGTPGNILLNTKTGDVRVLAGAVPANVVQAAIGELE